MAKSVFRLDLVGRRYGRWTVLSFSHKKPAGEIMWNCRCECGKERPVKAASLESGRSTSCGCFHREQVSNHGMTGLPTFKSWESMKQRCLNPNATSHDRYGGRGITIHEAWINSFDQFLADMGERPEGTTLDRIDPDGNYEPSNCRWAGLKTQQRNRNVTPTLTHDGVTRTFAEWSELTGVSSKILSWRIKNGWGAEKTLTTPALGRGGRRT